MAEGSDETHALVLRARSGDRAAFAALMARFEQGVYAHLLSRLREPGRCAELTQDAFGIAFATLPKLEKPASFRSWVIGIALNLARRHRRETANLDLLASHPGDTRDGATVAAGRERDAAVRQALSELPENYRAALEMHYFDRLRGRAIGEMLGISEGAVHMTLLRARKALAEKLKAHALE